MRTVARNALLVLFAAGLTASGCKLDPYFTGQEGYWIDGGPWPDAVVRPDVVDACVPTDEICDERDNDCDGFTDEDFDLTTNPEHCGECNNPCEYENAYGKCENAQCSMDRCLPGFWDNNNDPSDGCEYSCLQTNGGVETCDQNDNDCDGLTDEDFDFQNDPNHCGECNRLCIFFQGEGGCQNGNCVLAACNSGYVDKDGDTNNGCECLIDAIENQAGTTCDATDPNGCPANEVCVDRDLDQAFHCSAIPADDCDGIDNDCDNQTDEDAPIGSECYTHPTGCTFDGMNWTCQGECHTGFMGCVGGVVQCTQLQGPAGEICDDLDNDCNGVTDDPFDKQNDPANCGTCGNNCSAVVPNAIAGCANAACYIIVCLPGFWDDNNDPADGCEYACTFTNGGVEACGDNVDNDCDGDTDEGFDYQNDPSNCGGCGNDCEVNKPFGTSSTGCSGGACQYQCLADHYDLNGDLSAGPAGNGCEYACTATGAELCDGIDNDCNGQTDETFNTSTDIDNCGACGYACVTHAGTGSSATGCSGGVCQFACLANNYDLNGDVGLGDQGDGCEYACTPSGAEDCDGDDDDCDGLTDEDANGSPLVQSCYTGAGGTEGVGPCRAGTETCSGGGWGACQGEVTPGNEACDGVDNDCDNDTDEDAGGAPLAQACYTGPPATENVGPCVGGTQSCNTGIWGTCQGEVTPVAELCDTVDNDCDSQTDEDFDTQTDILNCGSCGWSCVAHAGVDSYATGCATGLCGYACLPNYYDLDGNVNQGDAANGCEYNCTPSNGGVEKCGDNADNDCDGQTDEGFDFDTDIDNCGSCGYACASHTPFMATPTGCATGNCQFTCQADYYDIDGDLSAGEAGNGCEYNCVPSGAEVCDDQDNDCDGLVDEDTDKQVDPNNCGSCGYVCSTHTGNNSNATGCAGGVCQFACQGGWIDLNGDVGLGDGGDGCEYNCTLSGGETCDGTDNDCDGLTDEDAGGAPLSQTCYTGPPATQGVGLCRDGTETCSGGGYGACQGEVTPASELCDGEDNDCDTQTDEDFDTDTDLNNCGACGQSCWAGPPANSFPSACNLGTCVYTCFLGFADLDGDLNTPQPNTGCEYTCPTNPPTAEFCDGVDNDCDGVDDNGVTAPVGFCFQGIDGAGPPPPGNDANNPCKGVAPNCEDPDGAGPLPYDWYCQWPASVENDPANPNQLLGTENLCNAWDGDCDGTPDDNFTQLGNACDDGEEGACLGTGTYVCDATQTGVECNITDPGASPIAEVCDGTDNDCDGLTDETATTPGSNPSYVTDDTVHIVSGGNDFWIDVYEASRPDATASFAGAMSHRSCSLPDRLPWSNVSWTDADAACAAAGKRLCTEAEWQYACEGLAGWNYPYGNGYEPEFCNGKDYDPDCAPPDDDSVLPTGTPYGCPPPGATLCISDESVIDMSGNLMEWSGTTVSASPLTYRIRGGSFWNQPGGLTCQSDFISAGPTFRYDDLGFRCCSD